MGFMMLLVIGVIVIIALKIAKIPKPPAVSILDECFDMKQGVTCMLGLPCLPADTSDMLML